MHLENHKLDTRVSISENAIKPHEEVHQHFDESLLSHLRVATFEKVGRIYM